MTTRTPSRFPSYSTWLRGHTDGFLRELMARRPDVITPPPAGFDAIVSRLALRPSIIRAISELSLPAHLVMEMVAELHRAYSPTATANAANKAPGTNAATGPSGTTDSDGHPVFSVAAVHTALSDELTARGTPPRTQLTLTLLRQALEELRLIGLIYGAGPAGGAFTGKASKKSGADEAPTDWLALSPGVPQSVHRGWSVLNLVATSDPTVYHQRCTAVDEASDAEKTIIRALRNSHGLGVRPEGKTGRSSSVIDSLEAQGIIEPACAVTMQEMINTHEVRLDPRLRLAAQPGAGVLVSDTFRPPQGLAWQPHSPLPTMTGAVKDPQKLAPTGAAEAYSVLQAMRAVIIELSSTPGKTLKDSTLGVREATRLADAIGVSASIPTPDSAASSSGAPSASLAGIGFIIELGLSAGLLAIGAPNPEPTNDTGGDYVVATELADAWLSEDLASQWAHLIHSWYHCDLASWKLLDSPDGAIASLNPGSEELHSFTATRLRHRLLSAAVAAATCGDPLPMGQALAWRHPLESFNSPQFALATVIAEAHLLGLVVDQRPTATAYAALRLPPRVPGPRGLTAAWLTQVEGTPQEYLDLLAACREAMPASADMLIAQGDMTVIAPSPLPPTSQAMMERIAAVESPGLATVYRLDQQSLQAGLRSGLTVAEITSFLTQRLVGGLPQSLDYLLRDLGQHRPGLRLGPARSVIHCDDEAALATVAHHPSVASLGARLVAPTVLVMQVSDAVARDVLVTAGFDIVAEDSEGNDVAKSTTPIRLLEDAVSPPPAHPREAEYFGARLDERIALTLESLRAAADSGARSGAAAAAGRGGSSAASALSPADREEAFVATLKKAAQQGQTVAISHLDRNGTVKHRRIKPVTVSPRHVDGFDVATSQVMRILVQHISDAAVV